MFGAAQSIPDVLLEYRRALDVLDGLDIATANTRLSRYIPILEGIMANGVRRLADDDLHRAIATLLEVSDIVSIANLDRALLAEPSVLAKLRTIRGGRDYPHDYEPGRQDAARDNAFEFSAAAHLQEYDKFAGFSRTNGDLLAFDSEGAVRPVECKRATTPGAAQSLLRTGINQLEVQIHEHNALPGFVLMDMTPAIRATADLVQADSEQGMLVTANRALREFIIANRRVLQHGRGFPPSCLGVLLRLTVIGFIGETYNLRSATTWHAIDLQRENSAEGASFRAFANGLSRFGVREYEEPSPLLQAIISAHFRPLQEFLDATFEQRRAFPFEE